jgi:hypothetical protein
MSAGNFGSLPKSHWHSGGSPNQHLQPTARGVKISGAPRPVCLSCSLGPFASQLAQGDDHLKELTEFLEERFSNATRRQI